MKINNQHIKLKDLKRIYFGTSDDSSIWFDGSELRIATTVSGVDPIQNYHLATKLYVDTEVATLSGVITDHGSLSGLGDDDHTQYILATGSRAFTGVVVGVTPTASNHLATKGYIDNEISTLSGTLSGQIVTDHGALTGLGDDDHSIYIKADGTRAFTATISGVDPTQAQHLATKNYVDSVTGAIHKSGREALALNDSSKAVTFGSAFGDTNYSISIALKNTVDGIPSIYPMIITAKATTGFTVLFSGDIDSNNYELEWVCKAD